MTIYRGFVIDKVDGPFPYEVKRNGVKVYVTRTESDALDFIDKTKREESKATGA